MVRWRFSILSALTKMTSHFIRAREIKNRHLVTLAIIRITQRFSEGVRVTLRERCSRDNYNNAAILRGAKLLREEIEQPSMNKGYSIH